ncbi:hypothetical protein [Allorhizobium sonneratiae]|uniref:hypothetical protein n=1 Tax=Allorhizobium sonneratiae TaxID=2934936 RepID=UPI0020343C77|nr:hypothetical protein [Allorhizobium sonneratiae]
MVPISIEHKETTKHKISKPFMFQNYITTYRIDLGQIRQKAIRSIGILAEKNVPARCCILFKTISFGDDHTASDADFITMETGRSQPVTI